MKPERALTVDRTLAKHCPELLRHGPTPADLLAQLTRCGERLARTLGARLAPLMGGETPVVRSRTAEEIEAAALAGMIAPLAANSLFSFADEDARLLVSFQAEGVLQLVDRSFGGKGDVPSPLPEEFSLSAELMMQRLETLAAAGLHASFDAAAGTVHPLAHSSRLSDLPGFSQDARIAVLPLEVIQSNGASWTITLAAPLTSLEAFFGRDEQAPAARPRSHSATGEPFGDLPLTLRAVLVDMRIAVSALSDLRAGQVLPVSVARSIPIRIGEATIAHGTIGALDDRVAVQITQAF